MVYETKNVRSHSSQIQTSMKTKCSDMIYKARCIKGLNQAYMEPLLQWYAEQGVTLISDPLDVAWNLLRQGGFLCSLLNEYRGNTIDPKQIKGLNIDADFSEDRFTDRDALQNLAMFCNSCREDLFFKQEEIFDPAELHTDNMNSLNKALAFTDVFYDKIKRVKGVRFDKLIEKMKEKDAEEAAASGIVADDGDGDDSGEASSAPTDRRLLAMKEILDSEKAYGSDLDLLYKYVEELRINKILPQETLDKIFVNFAALTNFQQRYGYLVENTITSRVLKDVPSSCQGNVFKKLFIDQENAFDVYMKYVANLPNARALVKENMEALMELQSCMDPQGQLDSFLIKPTQRLCKYPLLIREVIRNSPEDAPDMDELKEAYAAADRNAARVNELLAQGENDVESDKMKELVTDWTLNKTKIDKDDLGRLVRFEKVNYMKDANNPSEVTLYLFERRLLMCRPGKTMLSNRASLTLKWGALIDNIHSYEDATRPTDFFYGFSLYYYISKDASSTGTILFSCRNAESVKLWMKAFGKVGIPSHDEVPDESSGAAALEKPASRRSSIFNSRRKSVVPPVAAAAAGGAVGAAAAVGAMKLNGSIGSEEEVIAPAPQPNERPSASATTSSQGSSAVITPSGAVQVKLVHEGEAYIFLLPHIPTVEQFKRLAVKTLKADWERRGRHFKLEKDQMLIKYADDAGDLINVLDDGCLTMAYRYITPSRLTVHVLPLL